MLKLHRLPSAGTWLPADQALWNNNEHFLQKQIPEKSTKKWLECT